MEDKVAQKLDFEHYFDVIYYWGLTNFLATLMVSQGTPMILGGDEIGRSQQGNHNPYCQDNESSWFDWSFTPSRQSLLEVTRHLMTLRQQHPGLRQFDWFASNTICWFHPDSREINVGGWETPMSAFSVVWGRHPLAGNIEENRDQICLCFNADTEGVEFTVPTAPLSRDESNGVVGLGAPHNTASKYKPK